MRRLLVLGLLLPVMSIPGLAQMVFQTENVQIHFYPTACEIAPVARYMKQLDGEAKHALVIFKGQRIKACWMQDEDGDFLIIDETGQGGFIPHKAVNPGA